MALKTSIPPVGHGPGSHGPSSGEQSWARRLLAGSSQGHGPAHGPAPSPSASALHAASRIASQSPSQPTGPSTGPGTHGLRPSGDGHDYARGNADIPLSDTGRAQADYLGSRIAAKGGLDTIATSNLSRDRDTASAVQRHTGARVIESSPNLGPWHQGGVEGMPEHLAHQFIGHYAEHPDEPVPGTGLSGTPGESLNNFLNRALPMVHKHMKTIQPGERRLLMSHHSLIRALHGRAKAAGKSTGIDPKSMTDHTNGNPGGVFRIEHDGERIHGLTPIDLHSPAMDFAKPGLFVGRHGATPYSAESAHPEKVLSKLKLTGRGQPQGHGMGIGQGMNHGVGKGGTLS